MTTIALFSRKILLVMLVSVISLGALPLTTVHAAGPSDDTSLGRGALISARLEWIFDLQQERFAHQTQLLDRIPTIIQRIQRLIDRATGKGLDATAVQAALDKFAAAVPAAQTAHDQAAALVATHAGFDDKGKVTDIAAALQTVKDIHQANLAFRDALLPPFRALRQSIRTFAQQNDLRQFQNATPAP